MKEKCKKELNEFLLFLSYSINSMKCLVSLKITKNVNKKLTKKRNQKIGLIN